MPRGKRNRKRKYAIGLPDKQEEFMPEQNKDIISKYQGEQNPDKRYIKLGKKITDVVVHKITGITADDPEYWGLREVVTPEMCDLANKMKLRKFYTFDQLLKKNPQYDAAQLQKLLDDMSIVGILEYDYSDCYDHNGELKNKPHTKRWRVPFFVPGSAELFNSTVDRIEKNPAVASFFERMTYVPLAGITQMVPPGGDGIGMHVIPVEKAINAENKSVDLEHISYWLKKYDGHIAAGLCSCRASRAVLGDGCTDDSEDWCVQLGDMADYAVETGRAHYITKERALEIFREAEKHGYVHQITNIDGSEKIFDICNCNVKICNALRTSMLFNTPYLSRSAYTANVEKDKCVACGKCVEICPAGAVKLGQKLCKKDGKAVQYPHAPLPDNNIWGPYAWDEEYRDTARLSNTYATGSSPCKAACPAHIPVQAYIALAKQGKYREALAMIKTENPFPAVCGRVCNKRCEDVCTRGKIDAPVSIDEIKKYVADVEIKSTERYIPEKSTQSLVRDSYPEKIAIIGGGPAGLSAAFYLAQMGYTPTIFEKNEKLGGMLTYGIPSYKLEKDVIEAEIDVIRQMGAEIKLGVEVGKDVTIAKLKEEGYKAFYVAIGCQGGKRPNVENDAAEGTEIAVNYLRDSFEDQTKFDGDVVVVGGGNVAVDCARTAIRSGAKSVNMVCLEQRDEMPASKQEVAETLEENIQIVNGWGPKSVRTDESGKVCSIVFKKCVKVYDENKKFAPVYDENDTLELPAGKVVFAIGQSIVWGNLLDGTNVKFWHGNYPIADKLTYQTDDPDIFVGGDVFTGPRFVIDAIAQGHEAAESLHRHVRPKAHATIGRDRRQYTPLNTDDLTYPDYDHAGRNEPDPDAEVDKTSFADPRRTFTEEQVRAEANRCLGCGASYVDPHKCIGCGLCTTKCQFDAIHLVRDHPKCTTMRAGEQKVGGLLGYALKRSFRILGHLGSKEARGLAKKRKAYKRAHKKSASTAKAE